MTNETIQAYLAAAKAARGLAERCYLQATPKTIAMTRLLSTTTPHLADAVVALAAEVERLQNELRVAEQTIADFYETGDSP